MPLVAGPIQGVADRGYAGFREPHPFRQLGEVASHLLSGRLDTPLFFMSYENSEGGSPAKRSGPGGAGKHPEARKRGRTLPVPNPSVTLGLASGGTISIVAAAV